MIRRSKEAEKIINRLKKTPQYWIESIKFEIACWWYKLFKKPGCTWKRQDDDQNIWETACDQLHVFFEGGPKENMHKFCPYCGRKIKIRKHRSCTIIPQKICDNCKDRHTTCLICDGPVFRVGFYGDGMICYHCGKKYHDKEMEDKS